jgi:hypothetical protein
MNIVDAFFRTPGWQAALSLLVERRQELREADAREAAIRRIARFSSSPGASQVLHYYSKILNELGAGYIRTPIVLGATPKITDDHLVRIAGIVDADTARKFVSEHSKIARYIITEQIIFGDTFWRLLFAPAMLRGITTGDRKSVTAIVIKSRAGLRRVCKVICLADGGFSVTAPYHQARAGTLLRAPWNRSNVGHFDVPFSAVKPFSASDRVKLSYHPDGFVQFSGEKNSKIISGRDKLTREPRGLGLVTNALNTPVQSGPSVGCGVWGLQDFSAWTYRTNESALLFDDDDFYCEPRDPERHATCRDGFHISFFVFPRAILEDAIGPLHTEDEIFMPLPMNIHHRETPFPIKLVCISAETALGVIAMSLEYSFDTLSGFELSAPSDGRSSMMAIYPPLPLPAPGRSLDYLPQLPS